MTEHEPKDEHRALLIVALIFAAFAIAVGAAYYVAQH